MNAGVEPRMPSIADGPPPHFIGIGLTKSGTTWLEQVLRLHPGIWMPPVKELHFFDEYYAAGGRPRRYFAKNDYARRRWRRYLKSEVKSLLRFPSPWRAGWTFRFLFERRDFEWYERLFAPGRGRICGEITPAYAILDRDQIAEVHGRFPNARIILQLRNPIERAWSHARMELAARAGVAVERIPEAELRRFLFDEDDIRNRGHYARIIRDWTAHYGGDRIIITLFDDLIDDKAALLGRVLAFLGLDDGWSPPEDSSERVVFQGPSGRMPDWARSELTSLYAEDIGFVADFVGRPDLVDRWQVA